MPFTKGHKINLGKHKKLSPEGRLAIIKNLPKNAKGKNNGFFGKHHTKETLEKISKANKEKIGYWRGKKMSKEIRQKISNSHKGKVCPTKGIKRPENSGKNHFAWKGNDAGYRSLHIWATNHLGKPDTCEHCGKTGLTDKQIHWANKDHLYKRIAKDWMRLCVSCHRKYDIKFNNWKK